MGEAAGIEINKTIRQEPFGEAPVQNFFTKWCEINGSIRPKYVLRSQWEERREQGKGFLEKNQDNSSTLFVPQDIHLWEMAGVIEAVDKDTFANKQELRERKKQKILTHGEMFRNSAVYIAQRLDAIKKGRPMAEELAKEFFSYGNALITGDMNLEGKEAKIKDIAKGSLSEEETEGVDRWMAGDRLYEKRLRKVEQKAVNAPETAGEAMEAIRRQTLSQFFRTEAKAFDLENKFLPKGGFIGNFKKLFNLHLKGRQEAQESKVSLSGQKTDSVHSAFLRKIEHQTQKAVETPKRELVGSIFRRGMDLLQKTVGFNRMERELDMLEDIDTHTFTVEEGKAAGWTFKAENTEMTNSDFQELLTNRKNQLRALFDTVLHWQNGEQTLRDALQIDRLKQEMVNVRESGDAGKISAKEREIADQIQRAVSSFTSEDIVNNPSEIVANQTRNCVGASMLGGGANERSGTKLPGRRCAGAFCFAVGNK